MELESILSTKQEKAGKKDNFFLDTGLSLSTGSTIIELFSQVTPERSHSYGRSVWAILLALGGEHDKSLAYVGQSCSRR
jgi:hypothetical protein